MSRKGAITIYINSEARTFRFGMTCWDEFLKLQQCDIADIGVKLSTDSPGFLGAVRDLFYSAALCHCLVNDLPVEFNRYSVGDWIDDMAQTDFQKVLETMGESKLLGKELALASKVLQAVEKTQPAPKYYNQEEEERLQGLIQPEQVITHLSNGQALTEEEEWPRITDVLKEANEAMEKRKRIIEQL